MTNSDSIALLSAEVAYPLVHTRKAMVTQLTVAGNMVCNTYEFGTHAAVHAALVIDGLRNWNSDKARKRGLVTMLRGAWPPGGNPGHQQQV